MNVLVVGDLAVDTVVRVTASAESFSSDTAALIIDAPGGQGANTARWLATAQGVSPHLLATVSTDQARTAQARHDLRTAGVEPILLEVHGPPARVISIVEPSGAERSFFTQRGAAGMLSPEHLDQINFTDFAWVHVSGYLLSTKIGQQCYVRLRLLARHHGVAVSVDPSSLSLIEGVTPTAFVEMLRDVDVIFPNEAEALLLSGDDSVDAAIKTLSGIARQAVIKRGAGGVTYLSDGQLRQTSGLAAVPVDPTGAGDAFAAGVISVLANSGSLDEAIALGQSFGRRCVETVGAAPSV